MRTPIQILQSRIDKAMDIPLERPDLLKSSAKRHNIKAAAYGALAITAFALYDRHYGLPAVQPELEVVDWAAQITGMCGAGYHAVIGVTQKLFIDRYSFPALEHQIECQPDNILPPDAPELER